MQRQADATLVWARISQRIFSRPLLIEAQSACVVLQALASRMAIGTITLDGLPVDMRSLAMTGQETIREQREYSVSNGVATVPIRGELVGRSARLQPMSGMTGYNAIGDNLETAAADQDVRGILLDIDSPGGELGARDLAERIKALDTEKPIWALIDDFGCSAAYYIAAAADRIVMPQEGAGGSIGAIAMLPDTKGAIESMGIKVHVVRSAALKGKPLSIEGIDQEGLSIIQNIVEKAGEDFVKVVSGFRGITQKSVNETQGAVIFGRDMLSTGLADAIMPAHEARQEFEAYVNRGSSPGRRNTAGTSQMANHGSRLIYCTSTGVVREVQARPGAIIQTAGDELIVPDGMTIEQFAGLLRQNTAPLPYAPPPPPAPAPQQSGGDVAAALEAERTRLALCMTRPEAKGREVAALRLALMSPSASPEQVGALLASLGGAPTQKQEPELTQFQQAMIDLGNPRIGPDSTAGRANGTAANNGSGAAEQTALEILSFLPAGMRAQ